MVLFRFSDNPIFVLLCFKIVTGYIGKTDVKDSCSEQYTSHMVLEVLGIVI